jgi:hypothetical protein
MDAQDLRSLQEAYMEVVIMNLMKVIKMATQSI